jgi:hypothetical protein
MSTQPAGAGTVLPASLKLRHGAASVSQSVVRSARTWLYSCGAALNASTPPV